MIKEVENIVTSFLVGNRGPRIQDIYVELELQNKIVGINEQILERKDSIEMQSCTQCHPTCVPQGGPNVEPSPITTTTRKNVFSNKSKC